MSPVRGYYGLIQYCPDPARLECANVGVLLYCPDTGFIEAKVSQGNDRVRRFFGKDNPNLDLERLKAAKRAIENRLKVEKEDFRNLDDLMKFIGTRANELRITQPRPIKVIQPEKALEELFDELVGGRPQRAEQTPLFPELDSAFQNLHERLQNRIIAHRKRVPVPKLGNLDVDYGFHNGSLNWVRTQRFQGENPRITELAAKLAMQGRFMDKYSSEGGEEHQKLIIVSYVPPARRNDVETRIKEIFSEVNQRIVTQGEVQSFAKEIQEQAH